MLKIQATRPLPRWARWLMITFTVLTSLIVALLLCFYLGEQYFFDVLFYKKSVLHGYYNPQNSHFAWLDNQVEKPRRRDLADILAGKTWSKKAGVKTIVVIGDSYVYGVGIRKSQRFSNLLAPELKKLGITAEVYTFAEPGNSIMDSFALYQLVKKQLDPDLIVLGIVSNDLFFNLNQYPGDSENMERFNKVCSGQIYDAAGIYFSTIDEYFGAAQESFSSNWKNRCYLEQIAKILGQDSDVLYFSFSPRHSIIACNSKDKTAETIIMNQYMSILEQYGVRGFNHLTHGEFKSERVSGAEGHPSAKTHMTYAQEISQFAANYLR